MATPRISPSAPSLSEKGSDPLRRGQTASEIDSSPKGQTPFRTGAPSPPCSVTRLTPEGRGAVAVIAAEGSEASDRVARHFVPASGRPLTAHSLGRVIFGRWEHVDGTSEEVVVCRRDATAVEVNCHGGLAAARAIVDTLVAHGAIEQTPHDWALSHAASGLEAEAHLALADARTERVAAILLDQYRGALRRAIEAISADLSEANIESAALRLDRLIRHCDLGRHLTVPWQVVVAGPPNVGKSSLMNRLLGYQRSIVFDQPGTTRDVLSAWTALDGWPIELTDTAGLRTTGDALEREGMRRATDRVAQADLTLLVLDSSSATVDKTSRELISQTHTIVVINKSDLGVAVSVDYEFVATSALTGAGLDELMQRIVERLVNFDIEPGEAVPFTDRQVKMIESARELLAAGDPLAAARVLSELLS